MSEISSDLIEKAYNILQHARKNSPISSKELKKKLGISDADGHPYTRKIIKAVMKEKNIPIAANSNGYFVIDSFQDLQKYSKDLYKRIWGIQNRIYWINAMFREKYPEQIPENDEFPSFLEIPEDSEEGL